MPVVRIINVSFQIWGSFMSLIVIICLVAAKKIQTKSEKCFIYMVSLHMIEMLMDALAYYFRGRMGALDWWGVRITNYTEFLLGYIMPFVFYLYMNYYLEEKTGEKIFRKGYSIAVAVMTVVTEVALFLNLFIPFMYQIDENNLYSRMSGFPIMFSSTFIVLMIALVELIKYRKKFSIQELIAFLIYILVPFVAVLMSVMVYGIVFGYMGTMIAFIVMFVFLQLEQGKRLVEKEKEVMQKRLDIAMSQIQPHFLYNTLSSISALCMKNPMLASETTNHFATYLRTNLDSVNQSRLVTFDKELEHIKTYLWIEKLRFGDDLDVTYEIEDTNFYLPALSVQPLVENAVVHGMMSREGVCHIKIGERIDVDKKGYKLAQIWIQDDGVGFDINKQKQDHRSHIGIENVSYRLAMMVHGTLEIESGVGKGTKVSISIPVEE